MPVTRNSDWERPGAIASVTSYGPGTDQVVTHTWHLSHKEPQKRDDQSPGIRLGPKEMLVVKLSANLNL